MKKSVYSLVLMDEVVKAIDDMAYKFNTSRSNLINQILAEHVSYKTPESLIKDIFDNMKEIMDNHFQIQGQSSNAMLFIKSPLRYKYKPTIRYRIELLKEIKDGVFGYICVSFRTQNSELINFLGSFFKLWYNLEKKYINNYFPKGVEYVYQEGKFIRSLKISNNVKYSNPEILGKAIGDYIRLLDSEIKLYFANIGDSESTGEKMEKMLLDNIISGLIVI